MAQVIIAIDGPAGSGKTTVCRHTADRLKILGVDTGSFYRAVGLIVAEESIGLDHDLQRKRFAAQLMRYKFEPARPGEMAISGRDVSEAIRSPEATRGSSYVATIPEIRKVVTKLIRQHVGEQDAVVEGRDVATVIFPAATLKIYLSASPETRAQRRQGDNNGVVDSVERVLADIARRDKQDSERNVDPLKVAPGAIILDTSSLSLVQVVARVQELYQATKVIA